MSLDVVKIPISESVTSNEGHIISPIKSPDELMNLTVAVCFFVKIDTVSISPSKWYLLSNDKNWDLSIEIIFLVDMTGIEPVEETFYLYKKSVVILNHTL